MTTETLINMCPHNELIELYHKRIGNEISQESLTDAIVDWVYTHVLSHHEHKSDPIMPDNLDSYYRLNSNERKNLHPESAQKIEKQIKTFEWVKSQRKAENIANKSFLIIMAQSFLKRNKLAELDKVEDLINGYEDYGTADEKEYEGTKVEIAKKLFKGTVRQWQE